MHLLLLCHGGGWDRLHQAASCAATAAASGWRVDLVFYHGALEKLVEGRLDEWSLEPRDPERERRLEDRADEHGTTGPAALLTAARSAGEVRLLACSASCALIGREAQDVAEHVDEVIGWPTTVALMERADRVLYL